jgi:lipopolysaccharide/colanic/teichoic acid biosynthesis glycosyltransferase
MIKEREGDMEEKNELLELDLQDNSILEHRLYLVMADSFYTRHGKRIMDLALVIPLLFLLVPFMALVYIIASLVSGQPVFYASTRLGRNSEVIRVWKFRTMVQDADRALQEWKHTNPDLDREYRSAFKVKNDPRVTRLGRILRNTSIDELPQLWNVLIGQMSLVGPRPYFTHELAPFPEIQNLIAAVTPGLTGPWQVQGRNTVPPDIRMEFDVQYVLNVSLLKDLEYLARTIKVMLSFDGTR